MPESAPDESPRSVSLHRVRSLGVLLVFFGCATVVWLSSTTPGGFVDLFETGAWLGPGSDMLAGKIPYRETFPIHGFLSDGGMDYFVWSALGDRLSLSLHFRHLLEVFLNPTLFLLTSIATGSPLLATLTIPLNVGFSTAVMFDRPVIPLLSLATFLWAIGERPHRRRAFLAGLLGGIGFLYALDLGTFVLAAEILTLAVAGILLKDDPTRSTASSLFLGLAIVVAPFLVGLLLLGALGAFVKVSFWELPRNVHAVWGLHFPAPWEVLSKWLKGEKYMIGPIPVGPAIGKRFYLSPVFGLLGIALALLGLRRREHRISALRLLATALACLFFFRHVIARFHLAAGNALAAPVFAACVALLHRLRKTRLTIRRARIERSGWALVLIAVAIGMNGPKRTLDIVRGALAYTERAKSKENLTRLTANRRGDVLVQVDQAAEVQALLRFSESRAHRAGPILDLTNRPALYFLLGRVNPTRFYQAPIMAPFQDEVIRDLERSPPAFVLLTSGTWLDAIDGRSNADRIPAVWRFVERSYPVRLRVGNTEVALPASEEVR